MKSILQKDETVCYLCNKKGIFDSLDKHHVFGGANRKLSEKYGLTVYLHHRECHIFGKNSVHTNAEIAKQLKAEAQKEAMKQYGWSERDFINIFGINYVQ